jgi:tRNA(adenine34) deaminase
MNNTNLMENFLNKKDLSFLRRAIALALEAERGGNLPIGAIISLDGEIVAEGQNAIWAPKFNANRHAEIEALRNVPAELWPGSRRMTLYTTLEPCLMCTGAILLHSIGKVIFGSTDHYGGSGCALQSLPPAFAERLSKTQWHGPALPEECDPLFARALTLVTARKETDPK